LRISLTRLKLNWWSSTRNTTATKLLWLLTLPRTDRFRSKSSSFSIKSKKSTSTTRTRRSTAKQRPNRRDLQSTSCAPRRASTDPPATNTGKSGRQTTLSNNTKQLLEIFELARHIFFTPKSHKLEGWKTISNLWREKPFFTILSLLLYTFFIICLPGHVTVYDHP